MYGQSRFHYERNGREASYPLKSEARYARLAQALSIENSLKDGLQASLSTAKHWQARWKEEAPEEVGIFTDIIEGSAEWVEKQTIAIGSLGCDAEKSAIIDFVLDKLKVEPRSTASSESYLLGALAGMALDQKESNDWQDQVASGAAPVQILLTNVPDAEPVPQIEPDLMRGVQTTIQLDMSRVSPILDPLLAKIEAGSLALVNIPGSWQRPVTKFIGMFRVAEETSFEHSVAVVSEGYEAWPEDQMSGLKAIGKAAIARMKEPLCGGYGEMLWISAEDASLFQANLGAEVDIRTETFHAWGKVEEQKEEFAGLPVYCLN